MSDQGSFSFMPQPKKPETITNEWMEHAIMVTAAARQQWDFVLSSEIAAKIVNPDGNPRCRNLTRMVQKRMQSGVAADDRAVDIGGVAIVVEDRYLQEAMDYTNKALQAPKFKNFRDFKMQRAEMYRMRKHDGPLTMDMLRRHL